MRVCLGNHILLDFSRFKVPENGVFSNQAVHSFQTKLLRTEINKARTDKKNVKVKLERARGTVQRGVDENFWPSVIKYLSLRGQRQTTTVKRDPSEEGNETFKKARPTSREARSGFGESS